MRFRFLYLLMIGAVTAFAQSATQADALFNQKEYPDAAKAYQVLLKKSPSSALYNYRLARCCYELKDYESAIGYFEAAGNRYPLTSYYLAESYFYTYRFSESTKYYTTYAISENPNMAFLKDTEGKIRRSALGMRLMNRVENIEIIDSVAADKKDFVKYYKLSKEIGALSQKQLRTRGGELADLVTFVTQRGDRKFYSDTIGSDLNLYVANKLLDGWGRGERLADNINSRWNENYPFLMLDGLTLYFASDDENSLGGYDIFITRYSPNTNDYLTPENVGMPFNSLANDYMMVIDEINGTGWFVSDRFQPEGRVMIYHFRYEEEKDYVRGDDGDVLRKTAMLVISKQATLPEKSISNVKTLPVVPEPERILFQVNDSVAYSDANEFKSQKALKMWYELEKSKKELSRQEEGLTELRSEYDKTGADQDRKRLSEKIAGLEKDIIQSKLLLKEKEISIRNEEINYLKN